MGRSPPCFAKTCTQTCGLRVLKGCGIFDMCWLYAMLKGIPASSVIFFLLFSLKHSDRYADSLLIDLVFSALGGCSLSHD